MDDLDGKHATTPEHRSIVSSPAWRFRLLADVVARPWPDQQHRQIRRTCSGTTCTRDAASINGQRASGTKKPGNPGFFAATERPEGRSGFSAYSKPLLKINGFSPTTVVHAEAVPASVMLTLSTNQPVAAADESLPSCQRTCKF